MISPQLMRDLRGQKMRTALTLLGIVWGTVAVSLLLAFGEAFHLHLIKSSRGLGNDVAIAWPMRTSKSFEGMGAGRSIQLTERDVALLRARTRGLGEISAEYQTTLKLQREAKVRAVDVVGVEPPFGEMRNLIPASGGRFLDPIDEAQRRRVAFLGDELARDVFGASDPVGEWIRVGGSPLLVVGVMQTKVQNSNYTGPDARKLFIPASTFRALTGQERINNFIYTAAEVGLTPAVTREVRRVLAARHRFDPQDEEALMVWDTSEGARFLDTFMLAFKLFLGVVGSLTLVVGGIGVSNIMNVVVEERTREIGIKMALGAKPRGILGQLLTETLILTALGGILGLGLSALICAAVPAGLHDFVGRPVLSPQVSLVTAAMLGLIGIVSGYFPARSAARLDPVVAMKV